MLSRQIVSQLAAGASACASSANSLRGSLVQYLNYFGRNVQRRVGSATDMSCTAFLPPKLGLVRCHYRFGSTRSFGAAVASTASSKLVAELASVITPMRLSCRIETVDPGHRCSESVAWNRQRVNRGELAVCGPEVSGAGRQLLAAKSANARNSVPIP